jgi:hypothetical protein
MPVEETKDLETFLSSYPQETRAIVFWLRELVWTWYPTTNELIYDAYSSVAFGWSLTEKLGHTFCSIAAYRAGTNVHFGFYWGSDIADPEKQLLGKGNQYRYIQVKNKKDFPKAYIKKLTKEAYANSLAKVKDPKQLREGLTIVKSISPNKRK